MRMIPQQEIEQIAEAAAQANLSMQSVRRVLSEPMVDSTGEEALRLTVIVLPGSVERAGDDALVNTLVQIKQDLQRAGEERFALVEFSTEAELVDAGAEP